VTTSFSTLRGAWDLRQNLKDYQAGFFDKAAAKARQASHKAWLVADDNDPVRIAAFLDILRQHQIDAYPLAESTRAGGIEFKAGSSWVLPVQQKQHLLLEALMERRTEFVDETFYDVSSWTLPLAFNLPYASTNRLPGQADQVVPIKPPTELDSTAMYYALPWNVYSAPSALQKLLSADLRVSVSTKPFTATTTNGSSYLGAGTVILPFTSYSDSEKASAESLLGEIQDNSPIRVVAITSGLTSSGPDLGSNDLTVLKPIKPLLLTGWESSGYEAGEVWHLLDTRVGIAPTMVESYQLGSIELSEYTHLVMVNGDYENLPKGAVSAVERWVEEGGILVAIKGAATWAESLFVDTEEEQSEEADTDESDSGPVEKRSYGDFDDDAAQRVIGGAIVAANLDLTHPLAFGYERADLPLFRNSTVVLEPSANAYSTVASYTSDPVLSGFVGPERLEEFRGKPAMIAERVEEGLVIRIADNPGFRAYWYGTQRLLLNALYFGQAVETTELD